MEVATQQVGVEVLALEVGGEGADQEVVVGEGVGQGVQDQALPLLHVVAVQGLQVLGAGEVGVEVAAVVGDQAAGSGLTDIYVRAIVFGGAGVPATYAGASVFSSRTVTVRTLHTVY